MEVKKIDLYSGQAHAPVSIEKLEAMCEEGWFPVSIHVPDEIGRMTTEVRGIFVKSGKDKVVEKLGAFEKKLVSVERMVRLVLQDKQDKQDKKDKRKGK